VIRRFSCVARGRTPSVFDRLASSMLASLARNHRSQIIARRNQSLAESSRRNTQIDSRPRRSFKERRQRCSQVLARGAVRTPRPHERKFSFAGLAVESGRVRGVVRIHRPSDVVGTAMIRVSQPVVPRVVDLLGVSKVNWNPLPTREHFDAFPSELNTVMRTRPNSHSVVSWP